MYIALKRNSRLSALKKIDAHAHFTIVKKDYGASAYCLKEETRLQGPIEWGTRPMDPSKKLDWDIIKAKAIANQLDDIDAGVYVRNYSTLTKIATAHLKLEKRTF